jgi:hypothetical protein
VLFKEAARIASKPIRALIRKLFRSAAREAVAPKRPAVALIKPKRRWFQRHPRSHRWP